MKLNNPNCDETQKLKFGQDLKTQIVMKLKNPHCDETLKTQNSNCDETKKFKL